MSNQPISAAESARRVALYREGYSLSDIARACGVTPRAIEAHLVYIGEHEPRPNWRGRTIPERTLDRAVALYERGPPIAHIYRVLGISQAGLYSVLRRRNVPLRRWAARKETS